MKASSRLAHAIVAGLLLGAPLAPAQEVGETIEGPLTHVELRDTPRHLKVRWGGTEVQQTIANRTHVIFDPSEAGYFPNSELSDLKPGMEVRFKYTDGVLDRLYVRSVPHHLRPELRKDDVPESARKEPAAPGSARKGDPDSVGKNRGRREVRARLLDIAARSGELRADVGGRRESFRAANRRDLRDFEVGDVVILVIEERGGEEVVTEIRPAIQSGRVLRIDRKRREVVLNVDGREEEFEVEDRDELGDVRIGDRIRFEFEERRGRRVITDIR